MLCAILDGMKISAKSRFNHFDSFMLQCTESECFRSVIKNLGSVTNK